MSGRAKIVEVLSNLSIAEGRAGLVEGWADHVMLAVAIGEVNERPWGKTAGTTTARDELLELATRAKALGEQIQSLKDDTRKALKRAGRASGERWMPDGMMDDLRRTIRFAGDADDILARRPIQEGNAKRKPPQLRARQAAWASANAYFALTGRKPTVSNPFSGPAQGPFLDLVHEVFAALGLEAKPESYAKDATKLFRQRQAQA